MPPIRLTLKDAAFYTAAGEIELWGIIQLMQGNGSETDWMILTGHPRLHRHFRQGNSCTGQKEMTPNLWNTQHSFWTSMTHYIHTQVAYGRLLVVGYKVTSR